MQNNFIEFSRLRTAMNYTDVYRDTRVASEWLLLNSKDNEGGLRYIKDEKCKYIAMPSDRTVQII